jgi:hypothetical protein
MLSKRIQLLNDERVDAVRPVLRERMAVVAESLVSGAFPSIFDSSMRWVIGSAFQQAGADEGMIWLADAACEYLVPVHNTGPEAKKIVGKFRQPLSEGLISMVFATERAFAESRVDQNVKHSKLLDSRLGVRTYAMIAAPLYFLGACRGVVSCVQLIKGQDLEVVQHATSVLGRLIEQCGLSAAAGLSRL